MMSKRISTAGAAMLLALASCRYNPSPVPIEGPEADVATQLHQMHSQSAELLRVTLVRVEGGTIRGELEPYVAPDCHCTVTTVFRGALNGDRVDGQYTTRGPNGLLQEGRWRLERRKP